MSFSPLDLIKKGATAILQGGKEALQGIAQDPLAFGKDVLSSTNSVVRDIARGGAKVALDAGEAIPRAASTVFGSGEVAQKVVPPRQIPGKVGAYLGPLQSFSSDFSRNRQEGVSTGKNIAKTGTDFALNEPAGLAFKPIFAAGSLIGKPLVDVLFKKFSKAGETLAKTTDEAVITQQLNQMGVDDKVITHAKPALIKATTPEEVQKVLADSYDVIEPKYQGGRFTPKDSFDPYLLSKDTKNSLFNDSSGKFDKPDRFEGKQYSYNEAKTGKAENGQDLAGRIIIGKDGKGNTILKDGTHLLEAYRDLRLPIPRKKVTFEDGLTEMTMKRKKLPAILTGNKVKATDLAKSKNTPPKRTPGMPILQTKLPKENEIIEKIALSKDPIEIEGLLRTTSVDPSLIPDMAKKLTKVSSPRIVKNNIEGFDTVKRTRAELADPGAREELGMLEAQREMLNNTGFRDLLKYESKSGDFKGQLNINNGTGKFAKEYDTKLREVFNDVDNKFSSEELIEKYEQLKANYRRVEEDIKAVNAGARVKRRTTSVAPSTEKSPLDQLEKGSGASPITQADQAYLQLDESMRKQAYSLPDMIDRPQTPVKAKVNLLDYLRTPDRVLKKLGFEREAKLIKRKYDDYIKELPKNIEYIRSLAKQAPGEEASEKIFRFLDGQKGITLSPTETKVAMEIKDYLEGWADRLELPKGNRIANYITHIFDKELLSKEFDEELAKIIDDKLPGEVYDPFLEKRLGALGYKQDVWAALDAYVKRATRKVHMDKALEVIQNKAGHSLEFSNIEASQFKYIQRYINNVNMRPTEFDNLLDNSIKSIVGYKYGQRPVTYLTRLLRQMTYRGMLGLNPGSALRNLSQGINTYATLGEKYTALGYAGLFKAGARKEIEESGIMGSTFIQDQTLSATKQALEKIDKGLFVFFNTAEHINRGAAYFGAKRKYLDSYKKQEGSKLTAQELETKAQEYARDIVRKTQFSFGSVDTPVALQSDLAKTLAQFQTFTLKQTEFLTELALNKDYMGLLRYATAGIAFVYTIGQAFGMEPKELLPMFRFDTPPSLKLPKELVRAAVDAPDKYGADRDLKTKAKDIGNSAIGLFPGGTQIKKMVGGAEAVAEGGSFDKGGNLQFEQGESTPRKIQSILFGKYAQPKAKTYFEEQAAKASEEMKVVKPIYDQIQKLRADGKEEEALAMYESLGEPGKEVYAKLRTQRKKEETIEGKKDILPTFQKIRKLKAQGKEEEALAMYESLDDNQRKYYQLLKKQLEK